LGVTGFGGHASVTRYLEKGVDVLLACGTGLNDFATNAWSPLLGASEAFIQVDVDAAQLGKNYAIDLGLLGPIETVVASMLSSASILPLRRPEVVLERQPLRPSPFGKLTAPEVLAILSEVCPRDAVFTADMGEHLAAALHYLCIGRRRDFFTSLGFGSMGSGIVSAIGFQLGAPGRPTFAVCGDGGFLMNGSELATAVQHGVCVTFVVINDARLNMVHHGMRDLFGQTQDFSTGEVDLAAMARSFRAEGEIVTTAEQLRRAIARPAIGPRVLDVRIDPDVRMAGGQRDAALRLFTEGSDA
jgi:acetolactate synthase-1/2/3 large subunit